MSVIQNTYYSCIRSYNRQFKIATYTIEPNTIQYWPVPPAMGLLGAPLGLRSLQNGQRYSPRS